MWNNNKTEEPKEVVIKVDCTSIPKPSDDEILIFTFKEDVPEESMRHMCKLIREAIDSDARVLVFTGKDVDIKLGKKEVLVKNEGDLIEQARPDRYD